MCVCVCVCVCACVQIVLLDVSVPVQFVRCGVFFAVRIRLGEHLRVAKLTSGEEVRDAAVARSRCSPHQTEHCVCVCLRVWPRSNPRSMRTPCPSRRAPQIRARRV